MDDQGQAKMIKCSMCKCKYINDDEHVKVDFGYNRLNERFNTCVKCCDKMTAYKHSDKGIEWKQTKVICENCGETATKRIIASHKRQYKCQTHHLNPKPCYKEWVLSQDYDTLLWLDKQHYNELKQDQ